ncbi:hypothetical protein FKM82_012134 [Ascaphus truei]
MQTHSDTSKHGETTSKNRSGKILRSPCRTSFSSPTLLKPRQNQTKQSRLGTHSHGAGHGFIPHLCICESFMHSQPPHPLFP